MGWGSVYSDDWAVTSSFQILGMSEEFAMHIVVTHGDLGRVADQSNLDRLNDHVPVDPKETRSRYIYKYRYDLGIEGLYPVSRAPDPEPPAARAAYQGVPDSLRRRPQRSSRPNPYLWYPETDASAPISLFLSLSLLGPGFGTEEIQDLAEYVYSGVPLPILGSPPQALKTIADYTVNMAPGAAIIASGSVDGVTPARLALGFGTQIFWIYLGRPLMIVTSEAWITWLCKRMKVRRSSLPDRETKAIEK